VLVGEYLSVGGVTEGRPFRKWAVSLKATGRTAPMTPSEPTEGLEARHAVFDNARGRGRGSKSQIPDKTKGAGADSRIDSTREPYAANLFTD